MTKELIFALISTCFMLIGLVPLWMDIWKGRTIPHPFTTGIWLILVGFNTYVLILSDEKWGLIPAGVAIITLLGETLAGIRGFRFIRINWFDIFCFSLAIGCIIYYMISKNVINAVIFTTLVDAIAFLPTFKKGWLQPWTETAFNFCIGGLGQLFIIFSLQSPNIETSLFWGYVFVIDFLFVVLLLSRRYSLKGWKSIFE